MARTNIDIVVTVRDGASAPLTNVQNKLKGTGKAVKDTSADFVQFNKTLFTTAAFLGAFAKAFSGLKQSVEFGAELEKVTTRFERTMGPRGAFVKALSSTSNIVVDETIAMQSALHLGMLGIAKDSTQAANMVSMFGVAAAMAGKDASKGVTDLTEAIEDGNLAKLQEYGIVKKNDAGLMASFAAMNKAGGIYGTMYVKQMQLALVTKLLTKHTKDNMFMMLSTGQVVEAFGVKFQDTKRHIGIFLATAIRPLLEKMIPLLHRFKEFLAGVYKTNREIVFLGKSVLAFGTILTGFIATLGTLKLAVKLLGFAGVGLPGLLIATLALVGGFVGLTHSADGVIKKLELMGAFFKGIYELVTNFDPETGLSKISESTKKLLGDLYPFVKMISRVIVIVGAALRDIWNVLKSTGKIVDSAFGGIFTSFSTMFSKFTEGWTTWWTSDAVTDLEKFIRVAGVLLAGLFTGVAIKYLFGKASSLLGAFGIGSGSGSPKGNESDPIYTRSADGIVSKTTGKFMEMLGLKKVVDFVILGFNNLILRSNVLAEILTNPAGKLTGLWTVLQTAFTALAGNIAIILTSTIPELVLMLGAAGAAAVTTVFGAVALAIGYGIGTFFNWLLDTFAPKLSEAISRILFDILALLPGIDRSDFMTNGEAAEDDEKRKKQRDLAKYNKTNPSPKLTNNSLANLSTATSDDLAIVQSVGEQMQSMKQSDSNNMQAMMEKALASPAGGGRFISQEELDGFQKAMSASLASDENLVAMGLKAKFPNSEPTNKVMRDGYN